MFAAGGVGFDEWEYSESELGARTASIAVMFGQINNVGDAYGVYAFHIESPLLARDH